jgi:hypothetical protein
MRVMRALLRVAVLVCVAWVHAAVAQDAATELTPAGKAILRDILQLGNRPPVHPAPSTTFPLAICAFPRGLCGAVHADGSIAVPPRYDWIGTFSDRRAAVRLGGLYGFVDDEGREVVNPQYRMVDDFRFGRLDRSGWQDGF